MQEASQKLRSQPADLGSAVDRLLSGQRTLEEQLRTLRSEQLRNEADELSAKAGARAGHAGRVVVGRRDGLEAGELRDLALAVRDHPGIDAVGILGATGPDRVGVVVAVRKGTGIDARSAAQAAATAVGGGGGGTPELAIAGGKNLAGIEEAMAKLEEALGRDPSEPGSSGQGSD